MEKKLWRRSTFKRLMISFVLIILPIYLLSIIIYELGKNTLRKEISNSMVSQISYYLDDLEKEVQRIQTLQFDLVNDKDINRLASLPQSLNNIEKMYCLLRIQQRLYAIEKSSTYINDIFLMIPNVKKHISATSISDFDRNLFERMKKKDLLRDTQISDIDGGMYLNVQYPYYYLTENRDNLFIISIELSRTRLQETLNSMITNSNEGVFLLNMINQSLITTENHMNIDHKIYESIQDKMAETASNTEVVVINNKRYLAVYKVSKFFDSVLCKYVPENSVFQALDKYSLWFVLLSALALVIIIIYSMYVYKLIHKPLSKLAVAFKRIEKGDFNINVTHKHNDEFGYIYQSFYAMAENLKTLIDQVYKQKILVQKAEMKQLQSQINPHFLYNSFFIMNTMIRIGDFDNLERFTEQLGMYYQFVTRNTADEVPIANEINHARIYTEIQAMRFSNWIKVTFDELPGTFSKLIVPRLIVQPVIENAFEHGLTMDSGQGILLVKFEKREDEYHIIVEDNGKKFNNAMLEKMQMALNNSNDNVEITALQNIHNRIRLKFGFESGLLLSRGDLGGLNVTILIKYKEDKDNV